MGCGSSIDFRNHRSVFKLLNAIEEENEKVKFEAERFSLDEQSVNLYDKCYRKTNSILVFVKNKPLVFIEENQSKFCEILNRYYSAMYSLNEIEFFKAEEDLEDFVLKMMDYFNGIRYSHY